jgi:hypothetical protein
MLASKFMPTVISSLKCLRITVFSIDNAHPKLFDIPFDV